MGRCRLLLLLHWFHSCTCQGSHFVSKTVKPISEERQKTHSLCLMLLLAEKVAFCRACSLCRLAIRSTVAPVRALTCLKNRQANLRGKTEDTFALFDASAGRKSSVLQQGALQGVFFVCDGAACCCCIGSTIAPVRALTLSQKPSSQFEGKDRAPTFAENHIRGKLGFPPSECKWLLW